MPSLAYTKPVDKGTPICSSSRSGKLIPAHEYYHSQPGQSPEKIRRPLSPVRLRRVLKEETPPKNLTVKEKNEERARNSPFVTHMPKKKKEHYLFTIGSIREPDDPYLLMEMSLTSQLSKIVSPIKVNQNRRNLHIPQERKMFKGPIAKQKTASSDTSPNQHLLPKINIPGASPSQISDRGRGGTGGGGDGNGSHGAPFMSNSDSGGYGEDLLWGNLGQYDNAPIPLMPSNHAPSAHMLAANACATPASAISDLSDRDTMTPLYTDRDSMHTRASGGNGSGIYGDFEDDLVSSNSVNEDEYIEDLV